MTLIVDNESVRELKEVQLFSIFLFLYIMLLSS